MDSVLHAGACRPALLMRKEEQTTAMKMAMLACLLIALCFSFSAFAESADCVMSAETLQDKLDNCPY